MPEDLDAALTRLRPLLLDTGLVRAVASGHRRGARPAFVRAELRPVDLKGGRVLQVVTTDGRSPITRNYPPPAAADVVDGLLAEPFANWYVHTAGGVLQLRVTKRGLAQVHTGPGSTGSGSTGSGSSGSGSSGSGSSGSGSTGSGSTGSGSTGPGGTGPGEPGHDRVKRHLLDPGDPLFDVLQADAAKRRQVDAFLRVLAPALPRLLDRARAAGRPIRVLDLGCGNAYLTVTAHRWLRTAAEADAGGPVGLRTVGVEARPELVARDARLAEQLGEDGLSFVAGTIAGCEPALAELGLDEVDLALALHACDTATDEALAVAVRLGVPVVLAAPCCHHDVQRQLSGGRAGRLAVPHPYAALTRHGILRERFADVLTDVLRADLLRLLGYRVDVMEFVESRHTPRNLLLRAYRTGARPSLQRRAEYADLVAAWGLRPALAGLLADRLDPVLGDVVNVGSSAGAG